MRYITDVRDSESNSQDLPLPRLPRTRFVVPSGEVDSEIELVAFSRDA
jgi:hypothetical protein